MINANNETIGDQISFPVGTGSGESSGTIVNLAFKESPMYANANSSVILQAAIRSSNYERTDRSIEHYRKRAIA